MDNKVYKKLAQYYAARLRCIKNPDGNNWGDKHGREIEKIIKDFFPHGSGIDNGCFFDFEKSNGERLVLNSSFHCMDNNGYYAGWIDFSVIVTPSLEMGFYLRIKGNFGRYNQDLKNYLQELFYDCCVKEYSKIEI